MAIVLSNVPKWVIPFHYSLSRFSSLSPGNKGWINDARVWLGIYPPYFFPTIVLCHPPQKISPSVDLVSFIFHEPLWVSWMSPWCLPLFCSGIFAHPLFHPPWPTANSHQHPNAASNICRNAECSHAVLLHIAAEPPGRWCSRQGCECVNFIPNDPVSFYSLELEARDSLPPLSCSRQFSLHSGVCVPVVILSLPSEYSAYILPPEFWNFSLEVSALRHPTHQISQPQLEVCLPLVSSCKIEHI